MNPDNIILLGLNISLLLVGSLQLYIFRKQIQFDREKKPCDKGEFYEEKH